MNRLEFIVAVAAILFVAFALGWFTNWLVHRLHRVGQADLGELDDMTRRLHEAEEARDQAIAYLQQRESELTSQIYRAEGEARTAHEQLRSARAEAEELRAAMEHGRQQA